MHTVLHCRWTTVLLMCCVAAASATSRPPPPPPPTVVLTPTNHLAVRGPIDDDLASAFVDASQRTYPDVMYVYIASPGGSVAAGERMVEEMQLRNYTCVVDSAYSMAFALVQACARRWIRSSGTMMQHRISVHDVSGDLAAVLSLLHHTDAIRQRLDAMQAARVGLTVDAFVAKTATDWWLDATTAVEAGCADTVVGITCSRELAAQRVQRTETTVVGFLATATVREYSACPLVHEPVGAVGYAEVNVSDFLTTAPASRHSPHPLGPFVRPGLEVVQHAQMPVQLFAEGVGLGAQPR